MIINRGCDHYTFDWLARCLTGMLSDQFSLCPKLKRIILPVWYGDDEAGESMNDFAVSYRDVFWKHGVALEWCPAQTYREICTSDDL